MADCVQVEVIYAEPDRVWRCHIDVPEGSTVEKCVSIAAAQGQFATLDCTGFATGIFGEQCGGDRVVQLTDRIELYRPTYRCENSTACACAAAGRPLIVLAVCC